MNVESRSVAARLQAAARAKQVATATTAEQAEDLSGVSEWIEEILKQVTSEAESGNYETPINLSEKSDVFILAVASGLKKILNDVMIITDLGRQRIRVSWYRSNEC